MLQRLAEIMKETGAFHRSLIHGGRDRIA